MTDDAITVDNTSAREAGRELDALIAEKVFGAEWTPLAEGGYAALVLVTRIVATRIHSVVTHRECPYYSEYGDWRFCLRDTNSGNIEAGFGKAFVNGDEYVACETAPLAICLAALGALSRAPEDA